MNQITPGREFELPLYYHSNQAEIFFSSHEKKKIIAKGRRFGLTKGMANRAIEYLCDGISPGLWVDTVNTNIDRYIERYFIPVLRHLPTRYWKWRQQRKELEVFGNKLDLRSADKPENIEGFAYKFIMLNEAGIVLRNEYLYYNSILPMTLDFNPDLYIGGTPKGKGLFHQLAIKADAKENTDQRFFQFTSFDNPYLSADDVQALVDEIPGSIQKQEIYADFLEDSSTVFRNIQACAVAAPAEPVPGMVYKVGVDIARLQDYTVIIVLDKTGRQVYMDRFTEVDWSVQKKRIKWVAKHYNNAEVWLDSTGVGDPIFEDLTNDGLRIVGFHFTNTSKKQLIQNLMISTEQNRVQFFSKEVAPELTNELLIFEYEMTSSGLIRYTAPQGYHDDCVISLALANWGVYHHEVQAFAWRP